MVAPAAAARGATARGAASRRRMVGAISAERFTELTGAPPRDDDDVAPATKSQREALRREAKGRDSVAADAYRQGQAEGLRRARSGANRARTARAARRRRPPALVRRAAADLRRPVTGAAYDGLRVLGLSLALVALYLFLQHAEAFAPFVGGVGKAVRWLRDPTRSIPYGPAGEA